MDYLKQMRRKLQRCLLHMTHRYVVNAFESWVQYVENEHALSYARAKANRIAEMRSQDLMYLCLTVWVDRAHAWKVKRHRMLKASVHIDRLYIHRAFGKWLSYLQQIVTEQMLMHKVVLRMQRVHVSQCFDRWWMNMDYLKQVRRKLYKCLKRASYRYVVNSFENWHFQTQKSKSRANSFRKAKLRIAELKMRHSFERWLIYTDQVVHEREVMRKAILRMQRVHVSQCFDTWWMNVEYLKQMRRKLQKCLMRMMHRSLVHSFENWVQFLEEEHKFRIALRKADAYNTKCTTMRAFVKWLKLVRFLKDANFSLLNEKHRWIMLHSAFTGWYMLCRKGVIDGSILKSYLAVCLSRLRVKYFKKWVDYATFRKSKQRLQKRLTQRYIWMFERSVFEGWKDETALARKNRIKISHFINTWQKSHTRHSFRLWKGAIDQKKMVRALQELDNLVLRSVFERWRMNAMNSKHRFSNIKHNLFYMDKIRLNYYFQKWLGCVKKEKVVLQRFLSITMSRLKFNYLKHWMQYASYKRCKRSLSNKLILRYRFRIAARCLSHWRDYVAFVSKKRGMIRSFIDRWQKMQLQTFFSFWLDKIRRKKYILTQISVSDDEKAKRRLLKTYQHWKQVSILAKRHRSKVQGYIAQNEKVREKKLLYQKFYHWKAIRPLREKMAMVLQNRYELKCRSRAFKHWSAAVREKVALAELLAAQRQRKLKKGPFKTWQGYTKQKVEYHKYRLRQKWFFRWKFEVTLKESLYEESTLLEQVNLFKEEDLSNYYLPGALQSSYLRATEDIKVLEGKVAEFSKGSLGQQTLFRPSYQDSNVLNEAEAILNELESQGTRIRRTLAELKTP